MENFNLENLENIDIKTIEQGDIIKGRVLKIDRDMIYVDIGYKMEGKIDSSEFDNKPKVDEELEVIVLKQDEIRGDIILSYTQAKFLKAWNNIMELFNTTPYISGKITEELEKGYNVDIGIPALLPFSHIRRTTDFSKLKNKQLMFKILDIREKQKKPPKGVTCY